MSDTDPNSPSTRTALSPSRAVACGHLIVTLPVLAIMAAVAFLAWPRLGGSSLIIAGIIAWPWWSLAVPRWRRWALARGADPDALQRLAERTGLVWPRGWIFEKTEIPPRRGR